MPLVTLPAHFDGKKICLDEPQPYSLVSEREIDGSGTLGKARDLWSFQGSVPETNDFVKDIYDIRAQFEGEELTESMGILLDTGIWIEAEKKRITLPEKVKGRSESQRENRA